jgi:pilus assembly protein Flp/PilA
MHSRTRSLVTDFLRGEDGPTAVEYAVMLALIIVVCIAGVTGVSVNARATFNAVAGALAQAGGP